MTSQEKESSSEVFDQDVEVLRTFVYDEVKFRNRERRSVRWLQFWVLLLWASLLGLSWSVSTPEDIMFGLGLMLFFVVVLEGIGWCSKGQKYSKNRRVVITPNGIRTERVREHGTKTAIPKVFSSVVYPFSEIEDIELEVPPNNHFSRCFARNEPRITLTCCGDSSRKIVLEEEGALEDPNSFVVACRQALDNSGKSHTGTELELTVPTEDAIHAGDVV